MSDCQQLEVLVAALKIQFSQQLRRNRHALRSKTTKRSRNAFTPRSGANFMEEKRLDLLLNSEPDFYIDWQGVVLGLLITAIIGWGFWQDWKSNR